MYTKILQRLLFIVCFSMFSLGITMLAAWFFNYWPEKQHWALPLVSAGTLCVAVLAYLTQLKLRQFKSFHLMAIIFAIIGAGLWYSDVFLVIKMSDNIDLRKSLGIVFSIAGFISSVTAFVSAILAYPQKEKLKIEYSEEKYNILFSATILGFIGSLLMLLFWFFMLPIRVFPGRP